MVRTLAALSLWDRNWTLQLSSSAERTLTLCSVGLSLVCAAFAWWMWRNAQSHRQEKIREQRLREELEAYAQIELSQAGTTNHRADPLTAARALARRLCRTIADKSAFQRSMLLLRNADGRLQCVGSVGVDDLTVAAVEKWGEQVVAELRSGALKTNSLLGSSGARNLSISLGEWGNFDPEVATWQMSGRKERRKWRRAIVLPVRTASMHGVGPVGGRVAGAIVVCPEARSDRSGGPSARADRLLTGLESLAIRLGVALENDSLNERIHRAERFAGLGQLAAGVGHSLNTPLTAVLGFAELIAEESSDPRIKKDALTITSEALKMKRTVEELIHYHQPASVLEEQVDLRGLMEQLADACRPRLAEREIKLDLQLQEAAGAIRGNQDELRQVLVHLLNNASQAVGEARPREDGEEHAIRLSLSQDAHTVYLIVSDTGPGFEQPGHAFDPFALESEQEGGTLNRQGVGLALCSRVVREHGGEIAAFNLHPHGAAVVIELPRKKHDSLADAGVLLEDKMIA